MLKKLIAFSLNNSVLVLILAGLSILIAGLMLPKIPVDVFPELNSPQVVVMTEAGGYAADEVEQFVSFPIESSLNGLPGVKRVRSSSAISLSIVWVEFDWGVDIYRARQLVSERLSTILNELPPDVDPGLAPISSITGEIMLISLSSPNKEVDDLELRSYAEFQMRNQLLTVPGIAQVVSIGGQLPEYQINVMQDRLILYGLTIDEVNAAAEQAHSTASAGYLPNVQGQELPLRQTARIRSIDDIKNTVIRYVNGVPLAIGDVADVVFKGAPQRGSASDGGTSSVVLSIQKAPGTNSLQLTDNIDRLLDQIEAQMPKGMVLNRFAFRQADFIQRAIDNVIVVSRDAVIFVSIILILFLLNVRTTMISLTALPLSLGISLLALHSLGMTINVMTLGGLAVAIGELVDDAIIDVENVFRRLRENMLRLEHEKKPYLRVIFDASNEIRGSIFFATLIIVVVFVPLLFLQGLEGRFFRPLGASYIIAIISSLFVALTVTPVMCRYLLKGKLGDAENDSFLVVWLKKHYKKTLESVLDRSKMVLISAGVLTLLCLWLASTFGTSFMPRFNEGTYTVFLWSPPGTSLKESHRLASNVEKRIVEVPGVRNVVRRTGRAERDEHAEPVSSSEIEVTMKDGYDPMVIKSGINKILADVPGITSSIGQPIEHRLSHIMSGTPADVAINIFGQDLDQLRHVAKEIEKELKKVPGAVDVAANRELMIKTIPIRYRHKDLASWGLTPSSAAQQVSTAFYGHVAAQVNQGVRLYDVVVRLDPNERQNIRDVRDFILRGSDNKMVRLSEVADIGPEMASNLIARENSQRKAIVSCNVAEGDNLGHLVEKVKNVVTPIVNKYGLTVHYGGQFEARESAAKMITSLGLVALAIIFVLLYTTFRSWAAALLVMFNLPLGMIGGIFACYISGAPNLFLNTLALFGLTSTPYQAPVISIAGLVGFITLFGIAVRNGLLLVNHYLHLIRDEQIPMEKAIVQGAMERLVPILMTAMTAVLGLIPLALASGEPGSELLSPLAIVVLGGLTSSTILNLLVVPAGFKLVFSRLPIDKDNTHNSKEYLVV